MTHEARKRKGIRIRKEEIKLSVVSHSMTVYLENPKESTTKLLELTCKI